MDSTTNGQPPQRNDDWIPGCFEPNQQKFPHEELLKYAGKRIAWSWDGTHIVASASAIDDLYERLAEAGIPGNRVVLDYVDPLYS
jgi:hypothetical protein